MLNSPDQHNAEDSWLSDPDPNVATLMQIGAATAGLMIAFWAKGIPRRSGRPRLNDGAVV